jgi:predicted nucleic acid-binding protein
VLVALFVPDAATARAEALLLANHDLIVSDWASAELASAVSLKVRGGVLALPDAQSALAEFDSWVASVASHEAMLPGDVAVATRYLRRLDLPLRAPDALHIALCRRLGVGLLTFDRQMATAAAALGCHVLPA